MEPMGVVRVLRWVEEFASCCSMANETIVRASGLQPGSRALARAVLRSTGVAVPAEAAEAAEPGDVEAVRAAFEQVAP